MNTYRSVEAQVRRRGLMVDVSGHQAGLVDYKAYVSEQPSERPGLDGPVLVAICKASEAQGWADKSFQPHVDGFAAAGVEKIGAYHFGAGHRDPKVQAKFFHGQAAHVVTTLPTLDLEGCFDWKNNRFVDLEEVGAQKVVETYHVLGMETEQLWGREIVCYTGPGWIDTLIARGAQQGVDLRHHPAAEWFGKRKLWCAHYWKGAAKLPQWWVDYGSRELLVAHQYSGSGKVTPKALKPGQSLLTDLNECFDVDAFDPERHTPIPFDPRGWQATQPQPEEYLAVDSLDNVLHLVQRPGGQEPGG